MDDAQSSTLVLTQAAVAQLLECDEGTVQERARTGELPGLKFGRGWVFPREALMARLNTMAQEQAAERRGQRAGAVAAAVAIPAPRNRRRPPPVLPDLP